jgi:hypothetical protein
MLATLALHVWQLLLLLVDSIAVRRLAETGVHFTEAGMRRE